MLRVWHHFGMLVFFILLCLAIGQVGVFFTSPQSFNWYNALIKPHWTPPTLLFPIIWNVLYVLMAFAAWYVWRAKNPGYRIALLFWVAQLILNGIWMPLFFGQQGLFLSLVVMDLLWLTLAVNTYLFFKQSRGAGILMLIYLGWITFVGVINFFIWQMN